MPNYYTPCTQCQWRGKITLSISKRARARYARRLYQFEQWDATVVKPRALACHIDICNDCAGSGLVSCENFPKVDTNNYPHIAIIGGGIWWVALAVACLHRGIPYTLYERDESFDVRSQGYWLTLQQASKAIEWLGIVWLQDGLTSTRHVVHDTAGWVIGEWGRRKILNLEDQKANKRRNIHISRQALRRQLLDQLHNDQNIAWGHCLKWISGNWNAQLDLEFQVGDTRQITRSDLVVGADGIRSCVRSLSLEDNT